LFRKGRITEVDLDRQLADVQREQDASAARLTEPRAQAEAGQAAEAHLTAVEGLLGRLRERLDAGLDFTTRRAIVEALVHNASVGSGERDGQQVAIVNVQYAFEGVFAAQAGTGSAPRPA
jgi:C4-type Zn-finger protein